MSDGQPARESGFMDMDADKRVRCKLAEHNDAVAEVLNALSPASREFMREMFRPYLYPLEWVKETAAAVERFRAAARAEGEAAVRESVEACGRDKPTLREAADKLWALGLKGLAARLHELSAPGQPEGGE